MNAQHFSENAVYLVYRSVPSWLKTHSGERLKSKSPPCRTKRDKDGAPYEFHYWADSHLEVTRRT